MHGKNVSKLPTIYSEITEDDKLKTGDYNDIVDGPGQFQSNSGNTSVFKTNIIFRNSSIGNYTSRNNKINKNFDDDQIGLK